MATQPGRETKAPQALQTPTDMSADAMASIAQTLNTLLADTFALYMKTKNFHWHVSGPHFRDYHLLLEEQAAQVFDMTDDIAERVRRIGGTTLRSIGHVARLQRCQDNDESFVAPGDMLRELMSDNKAMAAAMREARDVCERHRDFASAALIDGWIDQAEKRLWFLFEASRPAPH